MSQALASIATDSARAPRSRDSGVRAIPLQIGLRRDLLDTLHALGKFRAFLRLAVAAELIDDLEDGGPYTIFAPADAAFAAIGEELGSLLQPDNIERLCDRLEYHLVRGRVDLGAALEVGALRSVHGAELHLREEGGELRVDGARVIGAPIPCRNGVIIILDRVLRPALPEVLTVTAAFLARAAPLWSESLRSA